MKKSVIIIGAGYSGMALANLLGKSGYSVVMYEKNSSTGGRISAFTQNDFVFDIGPSWYLMPEVFEHYYSLFDKSAQNRIDLQRLSPAYKVFFNDHQPITITGDLSTDAKTFEMVEPGAGDALNRYVKTSSQVYATSVQQFLYATFENPLPLFQLNTLRHVPKLLSLITQKLDGYVSRFFKDLRLKQILEYPMVFLGSSPFEAPAIYTLMSHMDFQSGVYYPKGGMQSLAHDMKKLGEAYDITYHFDSPVSRIITENGSATGVELANGATATADIIISSADLHHTETRLLDKHDQSYPASYWEKRQAGPSALLVSLGVTGTLPQLEHHNLYFTSEWKKNFDDIYVDKKVPNSPSIYVCNPSKSDDALAPKNHENLFFLVPLPSGVALTDDQQETLVRHAIETIATSAHIPDLNSRIIEQHIFGPNDFHDRYNAWEYNAFAGESHILKQSILLRTPNKSKKIKNLYYVGAGARPGVGLPMCLISAQVTYKLITNKKSFGPLTKEDV